MSPAASTETKLLWGDTHLLTSYSIDAFFNNNLSVAPDYAYRFAKGIPVMHPYHRAWMRLEAPLGSLAVCDQAEFIGGIRSIYLGGRRRENVRVSPGPSRASSAGSGPPRWVGRTCTGPVLTDAGGEQARGFQPVSSATSPDPDDLWA